MWDGRCGCEARLAADDKQAVGVTALSIAAFACARSLFVDSAAQIVCKSQNILPMGRRAPDASAPSCALRTRRSDYEGYPCRPALLDPPLIPLGRIQALR